MFRKSKQKVTDDAQGAGKPAETKVSPSDPSMEPGGHRTTIAPDIRIEGHIRGKEHLEIEGSLKGTAEIRDHDFYLGQKGRAEGRFMAKNMRISGKLRGTLEAEDHVEFTQEADFLGEIKAKRISIEDGAYFKGGIEIYREPEQNAVAPQKPDADSNRTPDLAPEKRSVQKQEGN